MPFEKPKIEGGEEKNNNNVISLEKFRHSNEKMLRVIEIMGGDFFPRNKIEKAFGIKIDSESIPEIPFSEEDLIRAKELGQFLILRVNQTAEGTLITIENMNKILQGRLKDGEKLLRDSDEQGNIERNAWLKNSAFFNQQTPSFGWALSSKEIIPESKNQDYLNQTQIIVRYLEDKFYKNRKMPTKVQEAIEEFERKKSEIKKLLWSRVIGGYEEATEELAKLKITKMFRPTPVEFVYDACVFFQNNNKKLLGEGEEQTMTSELLPNHSFVRVGSFDKKGLETFYFSSQGKSENIGTTISFKN